MVSVSCPCGVEFEANHPRARWHSPSCKKQFQRAAARRGVTVDDVAGERLDDEAPIVDDSHGLVKAVRADLEAAHKLSTVEGQVALELARRLANPAETGPSSLAKELRASLAAAKGIAPETGAPESVEDEVEAARRKREEARQAAGRS